LIQLAYEYMVPRPQRKYHANRRGLVMSAKQQKRAAALNRLNYHHTNANETYIVYVYVVTLSSALLNNADCVINQEIFPIV